MKLLFDQNLSHRLVARLADVYPASDHVRPLGLDKADDEVIWSFAREKGFAITSKDDDFHRAFLRGHPPKVVWLRVGNCATAVIEGVLRSRAAEIRTFLADAQAAFLLLSNPRTP